MSGKWESALAAWRHALSADHVSCDTAVLDAYSKNCSAYSIRPLAVLYPACVDQVSAIIKIAQTHEIALYPISGGKNWGYGGVCPVRHSQVIVDLKQLNHIEEVNAELGYAVVQPGVTQQQLSDYLRQRDIPFWMDCTGASPYSSLIGNVLERGFGHSPYGNRILSVANMQIVLGNGTILNTGFSHYPEAKAKHLYPYGVGPFLDGLFTQSNFGIVTRMTVWLMPIPEAFCPLLCLIKNDDDIGRVIERLRPLRLNGTLPSIVHIGNDLRALSSSMSFPQQRVAPDATHLSKALRHQLRVENGIGAWAISAALYGTRAQVAANKRALKKALAGISKRLIFLPPWLLALADQITQLAILRRVFPSLVNKLIATRALANMHSGIPTAQFLKGAYWRHSKGIPETFSEHSDMAEDHCGIIWLAPILPMTAVDTQRLNQTIEPIFERHGFDFLVTFSLINGRALAGIITIAFDAESEAESNRAMRCYDEALEMLFKLGYIPYRMATRSMDKLANDSDAAFWETVTTMKAAFDPKSIIAPGRYQGT